MKSVTIGTGVLFFAAILLAMVPLATAQSAADKPLLIGALTPEVNIIGDGASKGLVTPETGRAEIKFKFDVTVPGPSACVGNSIRVDYKIVNEIGVGIATISPSAQTQPYRGSEGEAGGFVGETPNVVHGWETTVTVVFDRTAGAFKTYPITISAQPFGGAGAQQTCSATDGLLISSPAQLTVDYFPSLNYLPTQVLQKTGQNKQIGFPVRIVNFSNGPTRVSATIGAEGTGGLSVSPPLGEVYLESKATNGPTADVEETVAITVLTPSKNGYTNKVHSFGIKFHARSDTAGDHLVHDVPMVFTVKIQGVYVPGFDVTSMVGALGVALLGIGFARRRDA